MPIWRILISSAGEINSGFALRPTDLGEGAPVAKAEVTLSLRSSFAPSRRRVISFFGVYS
jgi:hypothetical protein